MCEPSRTEQEPPPLRENVETSERSWARSRVYLNEVAAVEHGVYVWNEGEQRLASEVSEMGLTPWLENYVLKYPFIRICPFTTLCADIW